MTAIDKLRAALAPHMKRNVDPHEEFVILGPEPSLVSSSGDLRYLDVPPERESWQDDDGDDYPEPLTLFDMLCVLDEVAELLQRPPVERADEQPSADPGVRFMQILEQWIDDKRKLAFYKEREKEARVLLFNATFPAPVEGTQKHKLPDGRTIKAQYKINRKIDEAALPLVLAHMRELGVANADVLVTYKPALAKREWNSLSDACKLEFSAAIISSPSTPTLDIELPKGP